MRKGALLMMATESLADDGLETTLTKHSLRCIYVPDTSHAKVFVGLSVKQKERPRLLVQDQHLSLQQMLKPSNMRCYEPMQHIQLNTQLTSESHLERANSERQVRKVAFP
jgi:hypothetical protein